MTLSEFLQQQKEIYEKASKGPWHISKDLDGDATRIYSSESTGCDHDDEVYNDVGILNLPVEKTGYGSAWASQDNADFIVAARHNYLKLLEAVEVMAAVIINQECLCSTCKPIQRALDILGVE